MRPLLLVLFLGAPLLAHPGHGATPAHVHVDQQPVDVGAWVFVAMLGVASILTLRSRTRR